MSQDFQRPTVTYEPAPADPARPFVLTVYEYDVVTALVFLNRSDTRLLRKDIERAEQEDTERTTCEGPHAFRRADAQPLLPPGRELLVCKHCPETGVLERDGDVVPVGGECPVCVEWAGCPPAGHVHLNDGGAA